MKKLIIILLFVIPYFASYAFSLKEGFKLALENDMDSKVNENNLKNIKYDQDIAKSLLYPKLDLSAKIESTNSTDNQLTPDGSPSKNDEYELKFTQPLFDGYESKYEKEIQKSKLKSAIYFLKQSQETLAIDYAQSYVNTLREKDLLSLNKERVNISENIFNKVYKKVNSGYGTKLEFETAKTNLAESRVNLHTQRLSFRDALESLKFYVQTDFDSSELMKPSFDVEMPKSLEKALKVALEENPAINVAKLNVSVAVAQQRKTNKEFYPEVNFVTSYKVNNALYAEDDDDSNEYTVGIELNYNLYDGGKNTAESKKALQNIKEKQFLIRKSEYQTKNKLRLAWNSYKLNKEKKESLEQYLIVKKNELDAMIKEFDLGLKDLNSLLDEHVEYIDVKRDFISNSYDLLYAKYEVYDAMGKLSDIFLDKLPNLPKEEKSIVLNDLNNETQYNFNNEDVIEKKKLKKIVFNKAENKSYTTAKRKINSIIVQEKNDKSFKEKFLNAPSNKYTINLALATSAKKAQKMLDKYNLNDEAFYFSFRDVDPLQKIVMGVYNSRKEAKEIINSLNKSLKRNKPIVERIVKKQKLYHKYNDKLDFNKGNDSINVASTNVTAMYKVKKVSFGKIDKPEIQLRKIKKQELNLDKSYDFKDRFLNAPSNKYTINLAISTSAKKAQRMLDNYDLNDKAFYFSFRKVNPIQKIVYGVFNSKKEANLALLRLDDKLKRNKPRIEKISIKQKLYHKYNKYTFNSTTTRVGSI